jgi:hypothetical protein
MNDHKLRVVPIPFGQNIATAIGANTKIQANNTTKNRYNETEKPLVEDQTQPQKSQEAHGLVGYYDYADLTEGSYVIWEPSGVAKSPAVNIPSPSFWLSVSPETRLRPTKTNNPNSLSNN